MTTFMELGIAIMSYAVSIGIIVGVVFLVKEMRQ